MEISLLGEVVPFGSFGPHQTTTTTAASESGTPPYAATRQSTPASVPPQSTTAEHLSYQLFPPTRSGIVFDSSPSTNLDYGYDVELFIDGSRVVWSQGGVLRKIISFEAEREPVHQAFFAWFTSNAGQGTTTSPMSATGSTTGGEKQHILDDFDRASESILNFDRYSYSALSEQVHSTSHPQSSMSGMRQALVVFLNNVAKVYFHDGEVLVVPLPIAVRRAWPMSLGIVIEAVPYEDLPIFYNMFDPIEEFREIHITRAGSQRHLSQASDTSQSYDTGRNQHIVFMSQSQEDEKIALTFDSEAKRHRLWRYVLKPKPEIPYRYADHEHHPPNEHNAAVDDSEMDIDLMMQVDAGLFEVHSDIHSASESSTVFLAHALDGSTVVCIFDGESERLTTYSIGPHDTATQLWVKPVRAAISVVATRPFQQDILVYTLDHQLQLWTGLGSEFHPCLVDLGRKKSGATGRNLSSIALDALLGSLKSKFAPPEPEPRIVLMRDSVEDRVSFVLDDGRVLRVQLALRPKSSLIRECMDALAYVLPVDLLCELRQRFLSFHFGAAKRYQHVPSLGEWDNFVTTLLSFCEPSLAPLTIDSSGAAKPPASLSFENASAKDMDWAFFFSSATHSKLNSHPSLGQGFSRDLPASKTNIFNELVLRAQRLATVHPQGPATRQAQRIDAFLKYILVALHLVFEDRNLDVVARTECNMIPLLLLLAKMVGWTTWVDHYARRDFRLPCGSILPEVYTEGGYIDIKGFERNPPDILEWIAARVSQRHLVEPFPSLDSIIASWTPHCPPGLMGSRPPLDRLRKVQKFYNALMFTEFESERAVVTAMRDEGFSKLQLNQLPVAVGLPLKEALWRWRRHPPPDLDPATFAFIGRDDMAELSSSGTLAGQYLSSPAKHAQTELAKRDVHTICEEQELTQNDNEVETTGTEITESDITDLRFGSDRRIAEVQRMLRSSTTIKIKTTLDDLDEELLRPIHQEVIRKVALRTLALPVGRGIFTYGTTTPVTTQKFPIPPIQLAVNLVPVYGVTEFDISVLGGDSILEWSHFHNGVAAGLRISPNSTDVNSSWIIFNRPEVLDSTHAGFLCALGLTGHLRVLARPQVLRYLTAKHPMTSMGLLLGLSSTYCGTMDTMITKLLSIHIPALLPQRSSELSLSFMTQVAAILGIGLLYMESSHRRMAEIMLDEIGVPSDPSGEAPNAMQESQSLAAGFALGFITLGQGDKPMGLRDMRMVDVLVGYMPGNQYQGLDRQHKSRGLSGQARLDNPSRNHHRSKGVDQTSAGAVVAMGLMYLRTNSRAIAAKIDVPDTPYMLDFIKPDALLLRVICKSIILWDSIIPSKEWVLSHIPDYLKGKDGNGVPASEPSRQSYYSIIAGACYAIGLRFAGSNDETAYKCVLRFLDMFIQLSPLDGSYEESITRMTVRTCLDVLSFAAAMIVAGSGRIDFMRRIRKLHRRVKTDVSYGSHMAYHMALGLLFLGGGGYTLGTSNRCVAALLCGLYPRLPGSPSDNRSHLQSFRHLWVLAVQPRCLVTRDASTGACCPVPVRIHLKPIVFQRHVQMGLGRKSSISSATVETLDTTHPMQPIESPSRLELMSPCLLPDLSTISKIEILGPRYWPITLELHDDSPESVERIWRILRSRSILVKRHIGHMSYTEDLLGMRGILARPIPRVLMSPAGGGGGSGGGYGSGSSSGSGTGSGGSGLVSLEEGGPQRRKRARMDTLAFQNRLLQATVPTDPTVVEQRSASHGDDFGLTFLQDPQVAAFANYLCRARPPTTSAWGHGIHERVQGRRTFQQQRLHHHHQDVLLQQDDARATYFTAVLYECLTMDKVEVLDAHVWLYEIQMVLEDPQQPQISWQSLRELQILGRYYEHWRSQQNSRFEQENTSTMTMRNGLQKVNTDHHHHPSSSSYHPEDDDGSDTLFKIGRVTELLAKVNLYLERHQGLYLTPTATTGATTEDDHSMEVDDESPSLSQDAVTHAAFEHKARVYFETGQFTDGSSAPADEDAGGQRPSKTDWFKVWLEFHRIPGPDTLRGIRKAIQQTAMTNSRLQKLPPKDKELRLKQAFSIAFGNNVPIKVFDYLIETESE